MSTGGSYDVDPVGDNNVKADYDNVEDQNKGGTYETSPENQPCPPEDEESEKGTPGEYKSVSGDAICSPGLEEGDSNSNGIYEGIGSGPGSTPGHDDDCECENCCYYSSAVPNTEKVGGHEEGETYNEVHIHDMWYKLLHPYQYPTITLSLSESVVEVGACINSMTFNWNTANDENTKVQSTAILSKTGVIDLVFDSVETIEATGYISIQYNEDIDSTESLEPISTFLVNVSGSFESLETLLATSNPPDITIGVFVVSTETLFAESVITQDISVVVNSEETIDPLSYIENIINVSVGSTESFTPASSILKNVSGNVDSQETINPTSVILAGDKKRITSPLTRITSTTVRID